MTDRDYQAMARAVNPYVTWNLSRRKRFTTAERALIKRAHDELVRLRRSGLTAKRIRRAPGESQRAYKRRLADIKATHGSKGSALAAVGVRVSKSETVRVRGRSVRVVSKLTGRRQWYIAFDPKAIAADATRHAEVRRVWAEAKAGGATRIRVAMGARRRGDFAAFTDIDDMLDAVDYMAELYSADLQHILVGVLAEYGGGRRGP